MDRLVELVSNLSSLLYMGLGLAALRLHLRHRDAASKWLALGFGALAGGVAIAFVVGDDLSGVLRTVVIIALLVWPFIMVRFAAAFDPIPALVDRVALVGLVGLGVWTLFLGEAPEPGAPRPASLLAYTVVFILYWIVLSSFVTWRLWRAGAGQPTIARKRMRSLAGAAVLLSIALVGSGSGSQEPAVRLVISLLSIASTVGFYLAFVPPAVLRAAWRGPEEEELYGASVRLMNTRTRDEVASVLLPHVVRVVGAAGARLLGHDGHELGLHGAIGQEEPARVELTTAVLEVWSSRYTPFFEQEEERLLSRLGLLADLAIARADLLTSELEARQEVEAANAELEAFVYSASHDLKTPVLALLGFLDVIGHDEEALGPDTAFYLSRMRSNALYMEELISDLLELSRVGRVDTTPEAVPLDELVAKVREDVAGRYPAAQVVVDGPLPTLWMNGTRARQLFTNLVENAARYGGRPDVTIRISADGDEIRVADDGVGIPVEHHERVFRVFERLETGEGGTGIGLAICRKIVTEVGGTIGFVESDRGADLRVTLPQTALPPSEQPRTDKRMTV